MGPLFAYSISCSVLLALMYMAYKWVLASENQHRFNRIVLWSIYLVSLSAIPLGGVADRWLADSSEDLPAGLIEVGGIMMLPVAEDSASLADIICSAILWIYVSGMVVAMLHTGVVAVRLALIVRSGSGADACGQRVILIRDEGIAPFSVMGAIVMSHKDYAESGEMIVAHECCHVRHRHWVDLVMAQLVAVFQWYNPAAWLMREELKAVHEYQADSGVISSGVNPREYQMLLIKKAVGARFPSLANSLNHSKLKKRITMMYNPKTSASRRLRVLALAPAFAAAVLVTDIPAVAGAIDSASGASLSAVMPAEAVAAVTESKVTKNTSAGQPGLSGRQDTALSFKLK
ncbi:M56 family metallopeptidase [uncultured Duncaniella sp.]|uniref:M56 family metallopeptidase n=1 Tax=uncultured Duncaniella sp. TaxID=2768039 RepID=UPI002732D955|nr:M56 family metallopeptidase [uncultured Duncaniella sp.]